MKCIKPARGPSAIGAVGGVIVVVFGIFWTMGASSATKGAPAGTMDSFFPIFGVVFIAVGVASIIYNLVNATGNNRMSLYDVTDEDEEPDPLETFVRGKNSPKTPPVDKPMHHCPFCGSGLKQEFKFCPNCGKET